MSREWFATCKDCQKEFGYSDSSHQLSNRRGLSRPERCPKCRRLHTREISTLGLSHFDLIPVSPIPPKGLQAGRLGGLIRPERVHKAREKKATFDFDKFGIKDQHIREYFELMQKHQVTVIVAPTGAGKSTFLPYCLMVPPDPFPSDLFTRYGQIIVTQPRIQATRNIPLFVARDLHGSNLGPGFDVGFRHSGSPSTDWRNKMVYMTDGSLINMIVRNELHRLSLIMIDEAHERSLNIDLILGLLKAQLPRFPHLKLIIASATIDTDLFINYYGGDNVGFFEFPGKRQYPVESRFREENPIPETQMAGRMPDEVADKALEILLAMETRENPEITSMDVDGKTIQVKGDILAFLHGEKPIECAVERLRESVEDESRLAGKVDVFPLYTKLPQVAQDKALKPKKDKNRYRVVISTNVAETSLTVQGIVHVIETGLINESQWDPQTQTTFVLPKQHSQAGCVQRWGRAGRVQPGIAHCLYTQEQFERFPAHTDPEIMRAPLDQIVLTAKAAGVDDVQKFDWIQRPSDAELARAPQFLRQIGALDRDGDLTTHGLELRNFPEEIDVANLMILADRFGCAVEMATLIPMMKLGGYTNVLHWNRSWNAPAKRAVHHIHSGLIKPCLDDVEFYLKLWEAWEGLSFGRETDEQRKEWAARFFVNHTVLKQVASERDGLLSALSGHKKDDFFRPIQFDLLTRLRIVLTYGLSNQIYQLTKSSDGEQNGDEDWKYRPYIPDPESNPELVALHEDATIEISPESVCSQQLPDYFVCGKRVRLRRRISPQSDPETIITAAFLTLIKPDWIQIIEQPPIVVARLIASETRTSDGSLRATTTRDRLFIDQTYPIGTTYLCSRDVDDSIEIGNIVSPAPKLRARSSYEDIEAFDAVEVLEAEGELAETAGVDEIEVLTTGEEEKTLPSWAEVSEEDELEETLIPMPDHHGVEHFAGKITYSAAKIQSGEKFPGRVTGYDFSDRQRPTIQIDIPIKPDPFDRFNELYEAAQDITVKFQAIEQYVNDWLDYLVVREVQTGLEIVMDPYDVSIIGRNFAIEIFREATQETTFTVTIEELDEQDRFVRVNRLKSSQTALLQFMEKEKKRTVDAAIVEARDNGLYLWLDPATMRDNLPCGAFVHLNRLIERPEEMSLGETCLVQVARSRRPPRRTISTESGEVEDVLTKQKLSGNVNWDETTNTLSTKGAMTYDQRRKLLVISDHPVYQRAVNLLFRRSNELFVEKIIDRTGLIDLLPHQESEKPVKGKIVSITDYEVFAATENGPEVRVPRQEVAYQHNPDLQDMITEGEEVNLWIKDIDLDEGRASASMLDPAQDPWNDFSLDQIVSGEVVRLLSEHDIVLVKLKPGATGSVHVSELAWHPVESMQDFIQVGQQVEARIIEIDRENRRARFTMRLPDNDPIRQFKVNQIVDGKVVGFMKDGSAAFVELSPGIEGYLHKNQIRSSQVEDARKSLTENQTITVRITDLDYEERKCSLTIRGLYCKELWVPESHASLVIGKGGSVIKAIQKETQTYINLDSDSGICEIEGTHPSHVQAAEQRIQVILATRIVNFPLPNSLTGKLIGKGGSTIRRIKEVTGAEIDVERGTGLVSITALNDRVLQRVRDQVQSVLGFYRVVIQVPAHLANRIIGKGGTTIKSIQAQCVVRIDLEKDFSNKFTGRVTVEGKNSQQANQALSMIQTQTGTYTVLSQDSWDVPTFTEVRSSSPPSVRTRPTKSQPFVSRQPIATISAPTQPAPKTRRPQIYQQTLQLSASQIQKLTRKSSGLLNVLLGADKSILEKIRSHTGAQIKLNAGTGIVQVVAQSEHAVQKAIQAIKQGL